MTHAIHKFKEPLLNTQMEQSELKAIIKEKWTKSGKVAVSSLLVLFSCISNHNVIKVGIYALMLIIEWLHFLYLPIKYAPHTSYEFSVFADIVTVINYFRLVIDHASYIGLIVVTAIHAAVLVLIIVASILVIYFGQSMKIKRGRLIMWFSMILSSTLTFMTTALIIPMVESFIFPVLCFEGERPLYNPPYMACGSGVQIALSVVGAFLAIMALVAHYIMANVFVDDYWLSSLPWAGEGKDAHTLHELYKIFLALYLAADVEGNYAETAIIVFLFFQIVLLWKRIGGEVPYSKVVFIIKILGESTSFALYLYAFVGRLYDSYFTLWTEGYVGLIGICIGLGLIMGSEQRRKSLLRKNWSQLKSVSEAEDYVKALCRLCVLDQGSSEWNLMIRYLVYLHSCDCGDALCLCKVASNSTSKKERNELWLKIYEEILHFQAGKWEHSRDIIMSLSYFESIMMKNYFKSYYWLLKADELNIPFTEKYLIYRKKRILANLIVQQESTTTSVANVLGILEFQKTCIAFQKILAYSTSVVVSFWSLLETPRINVKELYKKGQKITMMLKYVNDTFKKAVEINPDYPYNYFYYGRFTYTVLNSENYGRDWIEKGRDIMKQQQENRSKYKENISRSPDTAIIVISGNISNLGIVQSANEHVQKQLGFAASDLIDRNISRVMPKAIGEVHDAFLLKNVKIGAGELLKHEMLVFPQTKEGLIEPVCLEAKTLPGLERGLQYIGFVRRDLAKLKSKYIKLPSQYKAYKLAYIMTDSQGYMIGVSKHACALFGLSPKYITRKKGITNAPYPLSKLAQELGEAEYEKKLGTGIEVTLQTKSILEYLDYDYLKGNEEVAVLERVKEEHRAFVMLLNLNYHDMVHLKVYIIVDLGKSVDIQAKIMARQLLQQQQNSGTEESSEDELQMSTLNRETLLALDSITSSSSNGQRTESTKSTAADIKKKASTRERTASIKRLVAAIFIFMGLIIINGGIGFGLYTKYMGEINSMQKVLINAFKRLTHFNICLNRLMAYMNFINGLEDPVDKTHKSEYDEFMATTSYFLEMFKRDEYNLETTMNADMPKMSPVVLYKNMELTRIKADFAYYTQWSRLNFALIELLGIGLDILTATHEEATSRHYVANFVQIIPRDTLTKFEQRLVFFFANSLSEIHTALDMSGPLIHEELCNEADTQFKILITIQGLTYSIVALFAIVFIPIILRIHRNKRNLLMLFGEIPLSTIKRLNDNCKGFLKTDLGHLCESNSLLSTERTSKTLNSEEKKTKTNSGQSLVPIKTEQVKTENDEVTALLLKRRTKRNEDEDDIDINKEEEIDETAKSRVEKAKDEKEVEFMKERNKSIKKVPIGLGNVIITVVLTFGFILAYHTKTLLQVWSNYNNTNENLNGIIILHRRFAYLTNVLLYFRAYLKSMEKFQYPTQVQEKFAKNFDMAIMNEKYVQDFKTFPSNGLGKLSQMLQDFDTPYLCEKAIENNINIALGWCKTAYNGLLNEGLTKSISFYLTRTRDSYLRISHSVNVEKEKRIELKNSEFKRIIDIFVRVYNPLFDYLADRGVEIYMERKAYEVRLMALDYGVEVLLALVGLLVFIKYFIKRMEEELFMARGILALLPESMIKGNKMLEALIEGHELSQLNVISKNLLGDA
eukprot:TRINITY_DN1437_c0_g1_i1.p1 TRINITY_DN1437_c0_g1~~TRINITY_DN1437_c0_g1_i1.p1  ORF type:complete len:1639 (-),score=200.58 TRINITY_DN1437_c0_g1_i1:2894-7810(-)